MSRRLISTLLRKMRLKRNRNTRRGVLLDREICPTCGNPQSKVLRVSGKFLENKESFNYCGTCDVKLMDLKTAPSWWLK